MLNMSSSVIKLSNISEQSLSLLKSDSLNEKKDPAADYMISMS